MKTLTWILCLCLAACCPAHKTCRLESSSKSTMQETNYQALSNEYQKLLNEAEAAMKNSYNPYSKFAVGSALLTEDDQIISGTNFENAAYGSTICSERAAILRANSMGYRKFKAIAIIARGEHDAVDVVSPCGACRQVIYEVSDLSEEPITVIMSNTHKDKIIIASINQLLPLGFGPKNLK